MRCATSRDAPALLASGQTRTDCLTLTSRALDLLSCGGKVPRTRFERTTHDISGSSLYQLGYRGMAWWVSRTLADHERAWWDDSRRGGRLRRHRYRRHHRPDR